MAFTVQVPVGTGVGDASASGVLTWSGGPHGTWSIQPSGTGLPAGASGDVQLNVAGAFGVDTGVFTYNPTTHTLNVTNLLAAAFSNSNAVPGAPANGQFWVVCTGTSPNRICQLQFQDGGTTHVLATITY